LTVTWQLRSPILVKWSCLSIFVLRCRKHLAHELVAEKPWKVQKVRVSWRVGSAVTWPLAAHAQQRALPVVGWIGANRQPKRIGEAPFG
jgi:hypothetical protein